MSLQFPLQGACSCGRNTYVISTPLAANESLQVLFDDKPDIGRALSLRIPLTHIRSTTYAFYPEETHNAIRRVFTPRHAPQTKRHFCGFCGTPLTYWSEESREEAEWVCVSLGSLKSESVDRLEDAGFLSGAEENVNPKLKRGYEDTSLNNVDQGREVRGLPWFEEMIEGSELGRMKRRGGGQTSVDGKAKVEWEIVELGGDDGESEPTGAGKRKLGMLGTSDDVDMRSG